jgi:hypothetical protein
MANSLDPEHFITRWRAADGIELANYQLFIGELSALLGARSQVEN